MNQDRVMLLIDADNVSVDVMEQAVRLLLNQHGGLHVRRAYCTAESAVKHQAEFKRLGIKPMVNLAAGKNSTDIAMAVDAIDLVLAERPHVVVIASSDSDFAPLVMRLREKGCVVRGIGQQGKTGVETQDVYDDFTVLEHRRTGAAAGDARPARKTAARKTAARKSAPRKVSDSRADEPAAGAVQATDDAASAASKAPARRSAAGKTAAAKRAPTAKTAGSRKVAASRKTAATQATADAAGLPAAPAPAPDPAPTAPMPPPRPSSRPAAGPSERRGATSFDAVLDCLPELVRGQGLALNVAVQRLREAQLLGKNTSSLKLFAQLSDRFELVPRAKPNQVRLRR